MPATHHRTHTHTCLIATTRTTKLILSCAALCCAVLCCASLRCHVLRCAALCCAVLRCAALRCAALRCAALPPPSHPPHVVRLMAEYNERAPSLLPALQPMRACTEMCLYIYPPIHALHATCGTRITRDMRIAHIHIHIFGLPIKSWIK
jgi:hypothetical protein